MRAWCLGQNSSYSFVWGGGGGGGGEWRFLFRGFIYRAGREGSGEARGGGAAGGGPGRAQAPLVGHDGVGYFQDLFALPVERGVADEGGLERGAADVHGDHKIELAAAPLGKGSRPPSTLLPQLALCKDPYAYATRMGPVESERGEGGAGRGGGGGWGEGGDQLEERLHVRRDSGGAEGRESKCRRLGRGCCTSPATEGLQCAVSGNRCNNRIEGGHFLERGLLVVLEHRRRHAEGHPRIRREGANNHTVVRSMQDL